MADTKQKDQFIPIPLPSKGLAYEGGKPDSILIRPFKAKDEVLISELTLENMKKKFVVIIKNVIQGMEPENLTSGDAKFIMFWEAINSYDQNYPIKLICENCLQSTNVVCDLGKIENVALPDDFKQPVEIDLSDKKIQLRLPTLRDEIAVIDWEKTGQSSYLYQYALLMADDNTVIDRIKMLEELDPKDLNEIKKFLIKYEHGPDMEASYVCGLCDYEGKIVLPFQLVKLFSFSE